MQISKLTLPMALVVIVITAGAAWRLSAAETPLTNAPALSSTEAINTDQSKKGEASTERILVIDSPGAGGPISTSPIEASPPVSLVDDEEPISTMVRPGRPAPLRAMDAFALEVFDARTNSRLTEFSWTVELIGSPKSHGNATGSHRAAAAVPLDMPFNLRVDAKGYETYLLRQQLMRSGQARGVFSVTLRKIP